ncbi:uncharacterized protein LOC133488231 [Phyllopteryx taeniolatus]|uniref:uncharacterized protein LOC133488231 n=1 Tax=Phyllopteryx taeniolatus TaxID=161469 RepID=UPI002AD55F9D|nr:uncharacterized protein LOC133488231 [Phyllopteryx taeniolatus]
MEEIVTANRQGTVEYQNSNCQTLRQQEPSPRGDEPADKGAGNIATPGGSARITDRQVWQTTLQEELTSSINKRGSRLREPRHSDESDSEFDEDVEGALPPPPPPTNKDLTADDQRSDLQWNPERPHLKEEATKLHEGEVDAANRGARSQGTEERQSLLSPLRKPSDHEDAAQLLSSLPDSLWSEGPADGGLCTSVTPVTFEVNPTAFVNVPQYPYKEEAAEGIAKTLDGLWKAGVLEKSNSPFNTPILPVKKADGINYRMAHDLRRINDITRTPCVPVPDPHRCLGVLGPEMQWFSVIDLANAFFCIPLAEECRKYFAFTYKNCKLQYTQVPQGWKLSPGIFNQCLREQLADMSMPEGSLLVQYVDDLLIAGNSAETCLKATHTVLSRLEDLGFKVSKKKLQCCRRQVTFLGRVIAGKGSTLSNLHRSSILTYPRPTNVKEMLSFLGLCGYSRGFIPDFAVRTRALQDLVRVKGMRNLHASLDWTDKTEKLFTDLKRDLAAATHLAQPDYDLPFHLDVSVTEGTANGALFQKTGSNRWVLLHVSVSLDKIEVRQPICAPYAAAVATCINKMAHIVMGHQLFILTHHGVTAFVASAAFTMPVEVAVVKCPGHAKAGTLVARGNGAADAAAKEIAGYRKDAEVTVDVVPDLQEAAPEEDKRKWQETGAEYDDKEKLWFGPKRGLRRLNFSVAPTKKRELQHTEMGRCPNDVVVMDFNDMLFKVQGKRYLLMIVDTFSGWPEAYPCAREDASSVIKALVNHFIPTHGFPRVIRSDNGTHFTATSLATVEGILGLKHKFGSVYHPQSQAHVERMNRTVKQRLAKMCAHTGLNWLQALPLVLFTIRQAINRRTGFTPFELLTGRLMPGPESALLQPDMDPPKGYKPYWEQLSSLVSSLCVSDPSVADVHVSDPALPSHVYLKVLQRKWSEPRWTGPFEVSAQTSHAVRLFGKGDKWYHVSQTRPAQTSVAE